MAVVTTGPIRYVQIIYNEVRSHHHYQHMNTLVFYSRSCHATQPIQHCECVCVTMVIYCCALSEVAYMRVVFLRVDNNAR